MGALLEKIVRVDDQHMIHITLPENTTNDVRALVFPINNNELESPNDEEMFLLANYNALTEEDIDEDVIWDKYV